MSRSRDRRRQYRGIRPVNASCRNHGSCPYCQGNRKHATQQRIESAEATDEADEPEAPFNLSESEMRGSK
jgi:hypothetical protein